MTARAIVLLLVLIGFVAAKADVKVMAFTYNVSFGDQTPHTPPCKQ